MNAPFPRPPGHSPGMRDFGAVYLERYDSLLDRHLDDPTQRANPRMDAPVHGEEAREDVSAHARLRRELAFDGDWSSYDAELRDEGRRYAALGATVAESQSCTIGWSQRMLPLVLERFALDSARLGRVLAAKDAFFLHVLRVVGEAFESASQERSRRRDLELQAVFASMADAVLTTDDDGIVTRANARASALLHEPNLVGRALADVWAASSSEADECELVRDDGSLLVVRTSRATIVGTSSEVIVLQDISAARTHQRQLHRWAILFQRIGWGICVTDSSGTTLAQSNDAFLRMYGFAAHNSGRTLASLFATGEYARIESAHGTLQSQTAAASYEARQQRADGSTFPAKIDAVRVPDVDGRPAWALAVHDLTERAQLDALEARSAALESANLHALEATRLKSEFLANMSHELRTPLNAIVGFSELLFLGDVGALSEQQHEFVGDIHSSGQHLLRLINDILDLSKIEAGKLDFQPIDCDLQHLCREVATALRPGAEQRGVRLEFAIDPRATHVQLDPDRLKQVLYNYLSNAIKFSPQGETVTTTVTPEGSRHFRVEVADVGCGIAPANMSRLFQAFEQLDAGRAKAHAGTGLGLALTRRLVEAQKGHTGARSSVGQGSVFFAVLPLRCERGGESSAQQ